MCMGLGDGRGRVWVGKGYVGREAPPFPYASEGPTRGEASPKGTAATTPLFHAAGGGGEVLEGRAEGKGGIGILDL